MDLPPKKVIFYSYVNVYQRVTDHITRISGKIQTLRWHRNDRDLVWGHSSEMAQHFWLVNFMMIDSVAWTGHFDRHQA